MFYDTLNINTHLGKILPLVVAHSEEIYGNDSNPAIDSFLTLAKVDMLRLYTANEGNEIVGYTLYLLTPELFRAHIQQADCVAIYLKHSYRGGDTAKTLIRFSEKCLTEDSRTTKIIMHSNGRLALKKFLCRSGYSLLDELVYKEIK